MKEPNRIVKFVFSVYEKTSADLKIRLRYDNLSQTKFFAGIVKLYLDNDTDMMSVIEKIKKEYSTMGRQKLKRTKRDLERGKEILENLGITETDKQDIFDMIEMDTKEYE